ncbi:hypothetical protein FKP32DRAFT_485507 [Trametes sanguinea]|nr:hypothetical protein FKP32DRAFT_485507 [Trametes sanguinea]
MPRKGPAVARQAQGYAPSGSQSKPQAARIPSQRKTVLTFSRSVGEDEEYIEDAVAEDDGEDENMVDMLAMLQEFQKRKASKASARSVAFQNQKATMFADARKRVDEIVRSGIASVENARATILDLKAQEVSQEAALISLKAFLESQDDCVQGLLSTFNGVIEDLAHRRAGQIDEASAMLESQAVERDKSRKRLIASARSSIEENIEQQKVATDANNLIKHFKALIRS